VSASATPRPPIRDQYAVGRNAVHRNDRPFRKLERFAADHALPFLNATDAFRRHSAPDELFLANDFHFTARGHALYAEELARYLVKNRFVGPEGPASVPR
jgi:hypothetical protein